MEKDRGPNKKWASNEAEKSFTDSKAAQASHWNKVVGISVLY
jgi:hypothetical protein